LFLVFPLVLFLLGGCPGGLRSQIHVTRLWGCLDGSGLENRSVPARQGILGTRQRTLWEKRASREGSMALREAVKAGLLQLKSASSLFPSKNGRAPFPHLVDCLRSKARARSLGGGLAGLSRGRSPQIVEFYRTGRLLKDWSSKYFRARCFQMRC
jgi:hypothetical protein